MEPTDQEIVDDEISRSGSLKDTLIATVRHFCKLAREDESASYASANAKLRTEIRSLKVSIDVFAKMNQPAAAPPIRGTRSRLRALAKERTQDALDLAHDGETEFALEALQMALVARQLLAAIPKRIVSVDQAAAALAGANAIDRSCATILDVWDCNEDQWELEWSSMEAGDNGIAARVTKEHLTKPAVWLWTAYARDGSTTEGCASTRLRAQARAREALS